MTDRDLGQSFFYSPPDLGKPRAEVMCANLLELNPDDVKGDYIVQSTEEFVQKEENDLGKYDLILVTGLDNQHMLRLSEKASAKGVPIILIR